MMTKTEMRKNLIGVVSVALSFALGFTLYRAFQVADLQDLQQKSASDEPAPKPAPPAPAKAPQSNGKKVNLAGQRAMRVRKERMKEFSGHGQAVSDNVPDNQKVTNNKQMIQSAPASEMLS